MVWMVFITFVKFFFGVYIFIYHRELLEVRNSPFNRAANILADVVYCGWVGGCFVIGGVGTASGLGVSLDFLLDVSGFDPVFRPLAKEIIDYVHKNTGLFTPKNINLPSISEGKLIKGLSEGMNTEDKKTLTSFADVYSKSSDDEKLKFWETVYKNISKK